MSNHKKINTLVSVDQNENRKKSGKGILDTLNYIKKLIFEGKYRFSIHAQAQLEADGLTMFDAAESVVNAINWYKKETEKGETKYVFVSPTFDNTWIYSVGKVIKEDDEDTYYFYITVKKAD